MYVNVVPNWEYLIRRKLMTQIEEVVKEIFTQLKLDQPAEDVGPT